MDRSSCERGGDCSSTSRNRSRRRWGQTCRRSCTRRPGRSRPGACRRVFINAFHAKAQLRRQDDLSAPTLFVICNASVPTGCISSAEYVSESGNVHPIGSIYCGNHQTTQSNLSFPAICELQKSSGDKCVEPAKYAQTISKWKQPSSF